LDRKFIRIIVNGELKEAYVKPNQTLLEVLRDTLDITSVKYGCGTGDCGNCTVLVDGKPVLSCLTLATTVDGKEILTVEGLAKDGELHTLQKKFVELGAFQCGYCTPAMILTAKSLLDENPNPTVEEIKDYMSGVLCRCTGYVKIIDAILAAAKEMKR
jgi:carbon-monoxide dehydrogenase small subunit